MNTNQVVGIVAAVVTTAVVGVCAWYMFNTSNKETPAEESVMADTAHFDHVTDQWHSAKGLCENGAVPLAEQDEFYKNLHREMNDYIDAAVFNEPALREHLHGKNAMFLSDVV